jgi:heme-degrading monooxygenase HmoA
MSIVQINALTVPEGGGEELERRFSMRAKAVDGVDGFEGFELLRPTDGSDRYLVVTRWASQEAFDAWTESREFEKGHANAGDRPEGHGHGGHGGGERPQPVATDSELWGFEVVEL